VRVIRCAKRGVTRWLLFFVNSSSLSDPTPVVKSVPREPLPSLLAVPLRWPARPATRVTYRSTPSNCPPAIGNWRRTLEAGCILQRFRRTVNGSQPQVCSGWEYGTSPSPAPELWPTRGRTPASILPPMISFLRATRTGPSDGAQAAPPKPARRRFWNPCRWPRRMGLLHCAWFLTALLGPLWEAREFPAWKPRRRVTGIGRPRPLESMALPPTDGGWRSISRLRPGCMFTNCLVWNWHAP
jgi:hypothetical protein